MYNLLKLDNDQLKEYQKELQNDLSLIDQSVEDVLHVLEFYSLDDLKNLEREKNICLMADLKTLRESRRDTKTRLQAVKSLLASKEKNKKQNLSKLVNKAKSPIYRVKILKNLFGEKLAG